MKKRIAIFCDGTWNQLAAKDPTNVVLSAQMTRSYAPDGAQQLIFYKQGVGTNFLVSKKLESLLAGAFGWGLFENIADAYRFLVFNYKPGDEIYIFGFSRGAFTARSLAGLIRKCGIVTTDNAGHIEKAFDFYRERGPGTAPDEPRAQEFRAVNSPHTVMKEIDRDWRRANGFDTLDDMPLFTVQYLGVWDTVGALGIPRHIVIEDIFQTKKKYGFHDTQLSSTVEYARHAVALDERRLSFLPTLWNNLPDLNQQRPGHYLEHWFPGDHGSVGGGCDIKGLSTHALLWIMEGAAAAGLAVDETIISAMEQLVHHDDPLRNCSAKPGWFDGGLIRGDRTGPLEKEFLSDSTQARLMHQAKATQSKWVTYRPASIRPLLRKMFPDEKL